MVRTILAIASLTLLWVFVGSTSAQPKEPLLPEGAWRRPVTGLGSNLEKAKKDALQAARKEVISLMQKHELTSFEPSEEFVVAYLLDGLGKAGELKEIPIDKNEKLQVQEWIVNFRTDTNWWREVVRRDQESLRKVNAEIRQSFMIRLMAGLAMVLFAGFGYVQVDKHTNYRYTTWLRVAGVGLVSGVLAAFWWIVV